MMIFLVDGLLVGWLDDVGLNAVTGVKPETMVG